MNRVRLFVIIPFLVEIALQHNYASLVLEHNQSRNIIKAAIPERHHDHVVVFVRHAKVGQPPGSLLHEVHIPMSLEEFKITHPVKIILRAQLHFRVLDDLG